MNGFFDKWEINRNESKTFYDDDDDTHLNRNAKHNTLPKIFLTKQTGFLIHD